MTSRENIHTIEDWRVKAPYEFPLYVCINDLSDLGCHAHLWHWHHEMQLCVILEGSASLLTQTDTYTLSKNEGIFINSDCVHWFRNLSTPCCKYICVNFHPKLLELFPGSSVSSYVNKFISAQLVKCVPLTPVNGWQKQILDSVRDIYHLNSQKGFGYEMLICAKLFFAVGTLFQEIPECTRSASSGRSNAEVSLCAILAYIEKHFTEKITLAEIAEAVHLSESECCRLFKRSFDRTIFDHILDLRIRFSADLLEHSCASVSEIAYKSGFSGTSYFIKQFRSRLGCTPKQYRKTKNLSNNPLPCSTAADQEGV